MPLGTGPNLHILLVEDDELAQRVVADDLRERCFEVLEAGPGDEALVIFGAGTFNLLVTDIRTPGEISGWDLAERRREREPTLPVIYVTGYSDTAPRQAPGSWIIYKPFDLEALADAILRVIAYREDGVRTG